MVLGRRRADPQAQIRVADIGGPLAALELTPGIDLLHSMRSVGYSFEAAVADIVDNSITAGAKTIEILVDVVGGEFVAIRDDGCGMTQEQATEALRLAGTARRDSQSTDSLGRFGLGLKTASLSQGRRVDVVSSRAGRVTALAWDIDFVMDQGRWVVDMLSAEAIASLPAHLQPAPGRSGTCVVWSKLDYLLGNAQNPSDHLAEKVDVLKGHLGMIFHRFLRGVDQLSILVNGVSVEPVDPFLEGLPQTQRTPVQTITIEGSTVHLQGFTLPHTKNIPAELNRRPDLGKYLKEHQGFYVYRNKRLISSGGWFGLRPKEELTKQARVRVDITDALDFLWQIDIRKARSEPPAQFRNAVRPLMDRLVVRSEKVHTFRGRTVSGANPEHYWIKSETRDGVRFEVNAQHPAIQGVVDSLPQRERALFKELLSDLADCFPYYDTYLAAAKDRLPDSEAPDEGRVRHRLQVLKDAGYTYEDVAPLVKSMESFKDVADLDMILKEVWLGATE